MAKAVFPLGIFLFGAGISLWYGHQGLHPLDSSIVFDGAWRLMSGQTFFQEFSTPNGFVPILIQVLFFKVLGVNWLAYCAHAAVFNGLFALVVFDILRLVGGSRWLAGGYAVMSAVVYYPPMGVPYMEQHSFFFLLLGVWLLLKAWNSNHRKWTWWLAALPVAVLFSILSKQNPGLFGLAWMPVAAAMGWWRRSLAQSLSALALGLAMAFLAFWVMVGWPATIWPEFWEAFWTRPRELAHARMAAWNYGFFKSLRTFAWYPFQVFGGYHFILKHLLYVPWLLAPLEWGLRKWHHRPWTSPPPFHLLLMGAGLTAICSFFMHFSQNQPQNGLPFVPVALGLGHVFWRDWTAGWKGLSSRMIGPTRLVGSVAVAGVAAWGAWTFHRSTNPTRLVLDFTEQAPYVASPEQGDVIGFLAYQAPFHHARLHPADLMRWLDEHPGDFLLFGDLSILYGLTQRPSIPPFLWFHEGLSLPQPSEASFAAVDSALLASCGKSRVRYVVFEHPDRLTYQGSQWECYEQTAKAISANKKREVEVGGFTVWELEAW